MPFHAIPPRSFGRAARPDGLHVALRKTRNPGRRAVQRRLHLGLGSALCAQLGLVPGSRCELLFGGGPDLGLLLVRPRPDGRRAPA